FGYAAQLVVLDRETGAVERVVAAHDVGRAVNPLLCEGQVLGAVHMGLGYALSEDFPTDAEGRPTAMTLRQLDILRPKDMPALCGRRAPRGAPPAPRAVRHQRGRRDRVGTAGRRSCCRSSRPRRHLALYPADEAVSVDRSARARTGDQKRSAGRTTSASITPGLVCAHHHLYSTLARGMPAPPATPAPLPETG